MDHHHYAPIAYDPELQRNIRDLKQLMTARDSESTEGRGNMCKYIKSVTLVFINQQTTRPGRFRTPHCQACMMTTEEVEAARPLAKADFDEYIKSRPIARAALADLVTVLGRLDGLESIAVLKRRNRETEPQWECEPVNLDGWVDAQDDGYADGLEGLSKGMIEQIVRLCNLPTLRRLSMNCRIPSFVWAHNAGLECVKAKGVLGGSFKQVGRGHGEEKLPHRDEFGQLVQDIQLQLQGEGGELRFKGDGGMEVEVMGDSSEGVIAMIDGAPETAQGVQAARFEIAYRGEGRHKAVESWLYKFIALSAETLKQLDLGVEELPKIRTPLFTPL